LDKLRGEPSILSVKNVGEAQKSGQHHHDRRQPGVYKHARPRLDLYGLALSSHQFSFFLFGTLDDWRVAGLLPSQASYSDNMLGVIMTTGCHLELLYRFDFRCDVVTLRLQMDSCQTEKLENSDNVSALNARQSNAWREVTTARDYILQISRGKSECRSYHLGGNRAPDYMTTALGGHSKEPGAESKFAAILSSCFLETYVPCGFHAILNRSTSTITSSN
jgi:hypothetical protein